MYVKVPADLTIRAEKAKSIVQDIAKVRLENSLVQAIALLRQKKRDNVVCNNCPFIWSLKNSIIWKLDLMSVCLLTINFPMQLSSLNDLLACDAAVPASQPLSWPTPGELDDLYAIYLKSIPKPEKLSRLQYLLGISNEKANKIRDAASEGTLPIAAAEEKEELTF